MYPVCCLVYVLRRSEPEFVQLNEKAQGKYYYMICVYVHNNNTLLVLTALACLLHYFCIFTAAER